jgi:hypothetical protein
MLIKTKFKGSQPVSQQESRGWPNSDKVTMMTVVDSVLIIGYLNGCVQIFNLDTEEIELQIAGSHLNCVRDVHYHVSTESNNKYLAVLYVDNDQKKRTYSMKQFLFTNQEDFKSSSNRTLFWNDDDDVDASKSE